MNAKTEKIWREGVVYGASMVAENLTDGDLKNVIKFYIEQGLTPWRLHADPETEPPVLAEWIYFFSPAIKDGEQK